MAFLLTDQGFARFVKFAVVIPGARLPRESRALPQRSYWHLAVCRFPFLYEGQSRLLSSARK